MGKKDENGIGTAAGAGTGVEEGAGTGVKERAGTGVEARAGTDMEEGESAGRAKNRDGRRNARRMAAGLILLVLAGILQAAARLTPGFGEWYTIHVYPIIVGVYGRFCGIFPFSVVELLLYCEIIWMIWYILSHFREIMDVVSRLLFLLGLLAFLYTACCGVNYYRQPFSRYLELDVRESSVEELDQMCEYLVAKVNETVDDFSYDRSWNEQGRRAMASLGQRYPQLSGYYPRPKGLMVSRILSVQQLSGIYSPFTVEANYNREMTDYNIPHTICHELSHLRGFMQEGEANFIGYLACVGSDHPAFRYSGYLTGWVYAGNALARQDPDRYRELWDRLDDRAEEDLLANNAFWDRFEGKVAEVSNQMNDVYLKINSQKDGVQSYGRVVDLMLAYYRQEQENQSAQADLMQADPAKEASMEAASTEATSAQADPTQADPAKEVSMEAASTQAASEQESSGE